jgi:hypothetical protein
MVNFQILYTNVDILLGINEGVKKAKQSVFYSAILAANRLYCPFIVYFLAKENLQLKKKHDLNHPAVVS